MSESFRTYVVFNPGSAGGGTRGRRRALERQLAEIVTDLEFGETKAPGHATELSRDALRRGFEMIVAVGGDGTVHEVVNGFFDGERPVRSGDRADAPPPVLGLIPSGTGGDYRKVFGLSRDSSEAMRALAGRATVPADAGRIRWTEPGVGPMSRYFVNIASFGMGAEVSRLVNAGSKRLGGRVSFFLATLRAAAAWNRPNTTLTTDGDAGRTVSLNVGAVAIGRYFGGGMQIAPDADIGDGQFNVVTIANKGMLGMLGMTSVYRGKHYADPDVDHWRGAVIEAVADGQCRIEADGEVFGQLPARFEIVERAFRVKVAG